MTDSYYNTTHETGDTLDLFEVKARTQEDIIMAFFVRTGRPWSPSQVWQEVMQRAPLTSVRRAITNLERAGQLVKTTQKVQGAYGRPECMWIAA